jgi:hypothetical protein
MAGKAPTNDMAAPRSDVTSDMRAVGRKGRAQA